MNRSMFSCKRNKSFFTRQKKRKGKKENQLKILSLASRNISHAYRAYLSLIALLSHQLNNLTSFSTQEGWAAAHFSGIS